MDFKVFGQHALKAERSGKIKPIQLTKYSYIAQEKTKPIYWMLIMNVTSVLTNCYENQRISDKKTNPIKANLLDKKVNTERKTDDTKLTKNMQNEPNLEIDPMAVTKALTTDYDRRTLGVRGKNEPKTNPNEPNLLGAQILEL